MRYCVSTRPPTRHRRGRTNRSPAPPPCTSRPDYSSTTRIRPRSRRCERPCAIGCTQCSSRTTRPFAACEKPVSGPTQNRRAQIPFCHRTFPNRSCSGRRSAKRRPCRRMTRRPDPKNPRESGSTFSALRSTLKPRPAVRRSPPSGLRRWLERSVSD